MLYVSATANCQLEEQGQFNDIVIGGHCGDGSLEKRLILLLLAWASLIRCKCLYKLYCNVLKAKVVLLSHVLVQVQASILYFICLSPTFSLSRSLSLILCLYVCLSLFYSLSLFLTYSLSLSLSICFTLKIML